MNGGRNSTPVRGFFVVLMMRAAGTRMNRPTRLMALQKPLNGDLRPSLCLEARTKTTWMRRYPRTDLRWNIFPMSYLMRCAGYWRARSQPSRMEMMEGRFANGSSQKRRVTHGQRISASQQCSLREHLEISC